MNAISKAGKHGTMYLYRITYKDSDPGCPSFTTSRWAYDEEHALALWFNGYDLEGWEILSVKRAVRS